MDLAPLQPQARREIFKKLTGKSAPYRYRAALDTANVKFRKLDAAQQAAVLDAGGLEWEEPVAYVPTRREPMRPMTDAENAVIDAACGIGVQAAPTAAEILRAAPVATGYTAPRRVKAARKKPKATAVDVPRPPGFTLGEYSKRKRVAK